MEINSERLGVVDKKLGYMFMTLNDGMDSKIRLIEGHMILESP